MNERPLFDRPATAKPEDLRLSLQCNHLGTFVLSVQYQKVLRRLTLGDPRLRGRVAFKAAMPVKMIRRDIQHHGDPRVKFLHRLQLKARYLEHTPTLRPAF